jgi:hypothetical protein
VSVTRGGGGAGGGYGANGTASGGGGVGSTPGTANTGGGGGGCNLTFNNNSNGGSGVVIIAYSTAFDPLTSIGAGLTYTVDTSTRSGFRVYTFTAGTDSITV